MRPRSASQGSAARKRIRKVTPKSKIPEPEIVSLPSENPQEEVCEESNLVGAGTFIPLERAISVAEEAQNVAEAVEVVQAASEDVPIVVEEGFKDYSDSGVEQVNEVF